MRMLVTGTRGMLGSNVADLVRNSERHELITAERKPLNNSGGRLFLSQLIHLSRPHVIINCVGSREGAPNEMIQANAIVPHLLAGYGVPLVHMSTDCVFSGQTGSDHWYASSQLPDANTLYGRSKLAGEVQNRHVVNVRGSFIGYRHGFLRWLLDARGRIEVWKNAYWNGTDVLTMAKQLVEIAESTRDYSNVVHVASKTVMTKAAMAQKIAEALDLDVSFHVVDDPVVRRVLLPDVELEPVAKMIDRIVS